MDKKTQSPSIQTKRSLRKTGIHARKNLGQHFLIDEAILQTIISAAGLSPVDFVIEVGPGLGILTTELVKLAGAVTAIELDTRLYMQLKQKLRSFSTFSIVNQDVLKVNLSELLGNRHSYKVIANIPYYITSPILQYFMQAVIKPSLMVVMVQKEVGQAIASGPGKMNMLSITMQIYSRPEIIAYVPSESFYPPPKVDSAIVRFNMLPEPAVKVADLNSFLGFVKCGFHSPRKQLRNSLSQGLGITPAEIKPLLEKANLNPQCRPETLGLSEWQRLYENAVTSGKVKTTC